MNQKKNLLTAALAVLTAFSSVSAQGGEDGGSRFFFWFILLLFFLSFYPFLCFDAAKLGIPRRIAILSPFPAS